MKKLSYRITTLEPLIITSHSDDPNMYETLQYIRGSVIQGLAAQQYLRKYKCADAIFNRMIIKGGCIFANAYPSCRGLKFHPAPFSLVKEKYSEKNVHNLLLTETDNQTKGISNLAAIKGNEIAFITFRKEVRLHNEIDDQRRTTREGILFNYQSIPAGIVFHGHIVIQGEDSDIALIRGLFTAGEYRIGRSSTAEYGLVRFEWMDETEKNIEFLNSSDLLSEVDPNEQIILTLLSDTIVFNQYGYSSVTLNDLSKYINGAEVIKAVARKERIEGFLNIWKLRKPSESVFAAGSSFLLSRTPENLYELETSGLGERTQEGYGQVIFTKISESLARLKAAKVEAGNIDTDFTELPPLTLKILTTARLTRRKSRLIGQSISDAESTHKPPSNHLIGKLKVFSQNPDTFSSNLKLLRETALSQLRSAYIGNQTLLHFLNDRIENFEKICPYQEDAGGVLLIFLDFKNELIKFYFESYFNQLRRERNKRKI